MTLIIALRAGDTVVVGSDSQSTAATQGQPTRQDTEKIFCLGDRIVWASAGSVGLTQNVRAALQAELGGDPRKCQQSIRALRPVIRRVVGKELREARDRFVPSGPTEKWQGNAFVFCGVTGAADESPWILEIGDTGTDAQHDLYDAIGSADIFAYAAYSSMNHLPLDSLDELTAQAVVYRSLDAACRIAAFGISLPVNLWVARRSGAAKVEGPAWEAVRDTVGVWLQLEADLLPKLTPPPGGAESPDKRPVSRGS